MSPVLFISLPFVLLLLMSQGAGAHNKPKKAKGSQTSEFQDGDIIIIRKQSKKQY